MPSGIPIILEADSSVGANGYRIQFVGDVAARMLMGSRADLATIKQDIQENEVMFNESDDSMIYRKNGNFYKVTVTSV